MLYWLRENQTRISWLIVLAEKTSVRMVKSCSIKAERSILVISLHKSQIKVNFCKKKKKIEKRDLKLENTRKDVKSKTYLQLLWLWALCILYSVHVSLISQCVLLYLSITPSLALRNMYIAQKYRKPKASKVTKQSIFVMITILHSSYV